MNISYRWLQALAPGLDASPVEVADRLAAYGAPADEIVDIAANLRDVVIARVVEARRHPNADRLSLCTVDAGGPEPLSVVCGAPNVKAGAFYPFAPVGAALPNGVKIRKAKIRGETSEGMLCSAAELGLGRDHSGILELRGTFVPGELFAGALGLDDARIVLDITPNRGDLLSHIGVARELAGSDVRLPPLPGAGDAGRRMAIEGDTAGTIRIRIDDTDGCPRYLAAFIRGVKVGPSPAWLDARLRAIGQRPINNVVDATNYILHELGQPLHAFDAARLGGEQIIVRRAGAGEMLRTLDGIERKLDPSMLVIADGSVPVALAGIMGGQDSEVTDDTVDVLLECALFDPATTRRTRNALGLSTDASYRFERGVDPEGMETALRRAVDLIVAVAGGTADGAAHVGAEPRPRRTIVLRESRVEQVLGVPFTTAQLAELLAPIGFDVDARDAESITVRVPGFRSYDVMREDDLVEEVARRHGYDEFPVELRPFRVGALEDHPVSRLEDRLRTLLVAEGFFETRSVPFVGEKEGDVALLLPLASNESRLRRTLLNTLIHRLEYNFARGIGDVRLFELGTVFAPGEPGELPREATHLGAVFTGARAPEHWSTRTEPFDVFDLKALGELLGDALELEMRQAEATDLPEPFRALLAAPLFALAAGDGEVVGAAGRLNPRAIDAPAWAGDTWAIELALRPEMLVRREFTLRPLPLYPGIQRDLALLVPVTIPAGDVEATIRESGGALLQDVAPFDLFVGRGIPDGTRSIAFRLHFRSPERTLTDDEVDQAVDRVLRALEQTHGVTRRA